MLFTFTLLQTTNATSPASRLRPPYSSAFSSEVTNTADHPTKAIIAGSGNSGMRNFMRKPVDAKTLIATVARYCEPGASGAAR